MNLQDFRRRTLRTPILKNIGAGVFLFEKQKMAIQHHWVNDENGEAHAYKLFVVLIK